MALLKAWFAVSTRSPSLLTLEHSTIALLVIFMDAVHQDKILKKSFATFLAGVVYLMDRYERNIVVVFLSLSVLCIRNLNYITVSSLPLQVCPNRYHVPCSWEDCGNGRCCKLVCQFGKIYSLLPHWTCYPWSTCVARHLLYHYKEEPLHLPLGDIHGSSHSLWNKLQVINVTLRLLNTEWLGFLSSKATVYLYILSACSRPSFLAS